MPRCWVTASDQIYPEGVSDFRHKPMRFDGQLLFSRFHPHHLQGFRDPRRHHRILHEGVRGDHMDRLFAGLYRQGSDGGPDQLQGCGGILASRIANNPRHLIGGIKFPDFLAELINGRFEAEFIECGGADGFSRYTGACGGLGVLLGWRRGELLGSSFRETFGGHGLDK